MGIMSSKTAQENGNGVNAKRSKLYNSEVTVVLGKCKSMWEFDRREHVVKSFHRTVNNYLSLFTRCWPFCLTVFLRAVLMKSVNSLYRLLNIFSILQVHNGVTREKEKLSICWQPKRTLFVGVK